MEDEEKQMEYAKTIANYMKKVQANRNRSGEKVNDLIIIDDLETLSEGVLKLENETTLLKVKTTRTYKNKNNNNNNRNRNNNNNRNRNNYRKQLKFLIVIRVSCYAKTFTKEILKENGDYAWLTAEGGFVVLQNGIEFVVTYMAMLLTIAAVGPGRISLDYLIGKIKG